MRFMAVYRYKTLKGQVSKEASLNFIKWWQFPHFYAEVKLGLRTIKMFKLQSVELIF
jgi:hypothetical protein